MAGSANRNSKPMGSVFMPANSCYCQRVNLMPTMWISTAKACEQLGVSRETLRKLRHRGVLKPGRDFRRWGCTEDRGPIQWHGENIEASITGWSKRNLSV